MLSVQGPPPGFTFSFFYDPEHLEFNQASAWLWPDGTLLQHEKSPHTSSPRVGGRERSLSGGNLYPQAAWRCERSVLTNASCWIMFFVRTPPPRSVQSLFWRMNARYYVVTAVIAGTSINHPLLVCGTERTECVKQLRMEKTRCWREGMEERIETKKKAGRLGYFERI